MKQFLNTIQKICGFLLMLIAIGAMARCLFFFINLGWSAFD
jgi:hypothetical protein